MDKPLKKIDSQVQLWILIGPILLLMTLFAVSIKGQPKDWTFSLIAISGIPFCWKWKRLGFSICMGLLALLFSYHMALGSIEERLWIAALSLTIAVSFVVMVLSFEEGNALIQGLEIESKSRLDNLFQLDEKFKEAQFAFQKEHELLSGKVKQAQMEAEEKLYQMGSYEKIVGLAREEIAATQASNEKLLQELFDKRHEADLLQQKLDGMQQQQVVAEALQVKDEELILLKSSLQSVTQEAQVLHKQIEKNELELAAVIELNEFHEKAFQKAQEEQILNQAIVQEMNEQIKTLTGEKDLLENALAKLQTELESYMDLSQSLKRCVEKGEEDVLSEKAKNEELKLALETKTNLLNTQVDDLTFKWSQATQQLAQWQQQFSDLQDKFVAQQAQIQTITQEKDSLLQSLQEEKSVQKKSEGLSVEDERSVARTEAKYVQLRQQFEEKSSVLDATRRELFYAQEKLLRLQKEMDEMHVFEINDIEAKLQDCILSMEKDLTHKEIEHRDEVQALHDVISSLICR